ncbi:hypothetical protein JTE90_026300 [Oedothorax gibbosus]|uniref:Uncharacterized protein n=1 Tax=Oedothorax gibbosus TaxID=931172 RepID=A0AAV6TD43_9ARAC|nr:hypothetical protein JTE90_026300 [Oedothorax gibbosus]
MHHYPRNQERALNLSILAVSWPVGFAALSQIEPQAPLLVVTSVNSFKFQLCNHTSPGTKSFGFRKLPGVSFEEHSRIAGWHRLWLELGRYLIAFDPLTFVLD